MYQGKLRGTDFGAVQIEIPVAGRIPAFLVLVADITDFVGGTITPFDDEGFVHVGSAVNLSEPHEESADRFIPDHLPVHQDKAVHDWKDSLGGRFLLIVVLLFRWGGGRDEFFVLLAVGGIFGALECNCRAFDYVVRIVRIQKVVAYRSLTEISITTGVQSTS